MRKHIPAQRVSLPAAFHARRACSARAPAAVARKLYVYTADQEGEGGDEEAAISDGESVAAAP